MLDWKLISVFPGIILAQNTKPEGVTGSCGGTFENINSGWIASPGFPADGYPMNANCTWLITVPTSKIIEFDVQYIDIEKSGGADGSQSHCAFDQLEIFDFGDKSKNESLLGSGPFCGKGPYYPVTSQSNQVRVQFKSDDNQQAGGFALKWSVVERERKDQFNCDFERGICPGWVQGTDGLTDDFDWALNRGKTPSDGTGPEFDHSKENNDGTYLFIEGSNPQDTGDYAVLLSPKKKIPVGRTFCLSFWYHMQGRHIGRLQISLALFNDEGDMTEVSNPLFLKDGEQSPEWQHSMVNVDENQHDFVLFFTAVRGNGYESDIGIDDIELFEEACEVVQERKPTVRLEIVKLEVFH